jgi:hypothetical protein
MWVHDMFSSRIGGAQRNQPLGCVGTVAGYTRPTRAGLAKSTLGLIGYRPLKIVVTVAATGVTALD